MNYILETDCIAAAAIMPPDSLRPFFQSESRNRSIKKMAHNSDERMLISPNVQCFAFGSSTAIHSLEHNVPARNALFLISLSLYSPMNQYVVARRGQHAS